MSTSKPTNPLGERTMALGLRALALVAGSATLQRTGMRKPLQRAIYHTSRNGFRTAASAGRSFKAARSLARPARLPASKPQGLFDLTPDDEQQMLRDSIREFAAEKIRPQAAAADRACATPGELLQELDELGINTLTIPEALGGVMQERSATTTILVAEALAHGDLAIAYAALAPGALAAALSHWGSAEQQATYLPAFSGENPPAAALAILEPRPLFDPFRPATSARRDGEDWILNGSKALIARASECELFLIAAQTPEQRPSLFLVESATSGLALAPEPAMGLRAAATGALQLTDVRVAAGARIAEGDPAGYSECIQRARLAWCALATGTAQAVLDHVSPYVNERVAFGEPISNRQGVAFTVANIAIELEGMRLATLRAASRADQGLAFAREAALARELVARHAARIGSEGVQLLGGHGYIKEHPVERWYRDLTAPGVMEGALLA